MKVRNYLPFTEPVSFIKLFLYIFESVYLGLIIYKTTVRATVIFAFRKFASKSGAFAHESL